MKSWPGWYGKGRRLVCLVVTLGCGGSDSTSSIGDSDGAGSFRSLPSRWTSSPPDAIAPSYEGVITLQEYDWFYAGLYGRERSELGYLAVIQIDLPSARKQRILNGYYPSRDGQGRTLFVQNCAESRVNRLALADAAGLVEYVTSCSSEYEVVDDPYTTSQPQFGFAQMSPVGDYVAAEISYFGGIGYDVSVMVLDRSGQQLLLHEGFGAPTWTPDGSLLMAAGANGLYLTDGPLGMPERMDQAQLNGGVNNPDVHPSGQRVIFEYQTGIWEMDLDGGNLRRSVSSDATLRYPKYSPDGSSVAYLATYSRDHYEQALLFTELDTFTSYRLDIAGVVGDRGNDSGDSTVVPNGPLSWTQ